MQERARPVRLGAAAATVAACALLLAAPAAGALDAPVLQTDHPVTSDPPHLFWNAVAGAQGYQVYERASCDDALPALWPTQDTSFDDVFIDLTRAARYSYTVQALSSSGNSAESSCVPVVFDPDPPRIAFAAVAQADGSVALGWGVRDFTDVSLVLRRSDAGGGPPATPTAGSPVCATPASSTGCSDVTATSGQRYSYSLFAVDAAGNTAAKTASALALDTVVPPSPSNLFAVPGDGQLVLFWAFSAATDVAGYRVVFKAGTVAPASVTDGATVCDVGSGAAACSSGGFANGAAVSLTVFARDNAGNWSIPGASASTTATPEAATPPPGPAAPAPQIPAAPDHQPPGRPTNVRLRLSATGVALTWRNPTAADLDHLVITRNAHHRPHGPGDGRRTVLGRTTHATLTAERGERFHLALYAYDRSGNVSPATMLDVTVPKVLPAPGTSVAGRPPTLSWVSVARAAYYNVVITRQSQRVAIGWPTSTSWTPPRLKRGLYRWYVWPGLGPKAAARYGRLIGSASFRIR